jgi:hypothetical protein
MWTVITTVRTWFIWSRTQCGKTSYKATHSETMPPGENDGGYYDLAALVKWCKQNEGYEPDVTRWDGLVWSLITEADYYSLLGAVPPRRYFLDGFVLGEQKGVTPAGEATWIICRVSDRKFYQAVGTLGAVDQAPKQ